MLFYLINSFLPVINDDNVNIYMFLHSLNFTPVCTRNEERFSGLPKKVQNTREKNNVTGILPDDKNTNDIDSGALRVSKHHFDSAEKSKAKYEYLSDKVNCIVESQMCYFDDTTDLESSFCRIDSVRMRKGQIKKSNIYRLKERRAQKRLSAVVDFDQLEEVSRNLSQGESNNKNESNEDEEDLHTSDKCESYHIKADNGLDSVLNK